MEKSCTKNQGKVFEKISLLIDAMNQEALGYLRVKLEKREEYAIDYVAELLELYKNGTNLDESTFVSGFNLYKYHNKMQRKKLAA